MLQFADASTANNAQTRPAVAIGAGRKPQKIHQFQGGPYIPQVKCKAQPQTDLLSRL